LAISACSQGGNFSRWNLPKSVRAPDEIGGGALLRVRGQKNLSEWSSENFQPATQIKAIECV